MFLGLSTSTLIGAFLWATWAVPAAGQQERWAQLTAQLSNLQKQEKYQDAIPVAAEAVRVAETTFGAEDARTAASLIVLARLYGNVAKYEAAEPLYERAVQIAGKVLGPERAEVASLLNDLGQTRSELGKYAEAEAAYKRAIEIQDKVLDPKDPERAAALNNLAQIYETRGKYDKAEPLMRRALSIAENAYGPDHPAVAIALNNLGLLYKKQGNYESAERMYSRALAIAEKALGPAHASVAAFLNNLGGLALARGQYAEAERIYRRALRIREQTPDHPDVAASLNDLAEACREQGKMGEAEGLLRRALAILEKTPGAERPALAPTLSNLAEIYASQGNYGAAEPLQKRALEILEKAYGTDNPEVATALNNLGALYENSGRFPLAEPLYKQSLEMVEKALGPEHPAVAVSLGNLAGIYLAEEKFAEAEKLYRRALQIREKALRPGHPAIAVSVNNLAVLYHRQQKYDAAATLYRRALQIQEKALGERHAETGLTLRNLATLEFARNRPAAAEPLFDAAMRNLNREFETQFPYMSEKERLLFLDTAAHAFPLYFSFCLAYRGQHPEWAGKMYDVLLWKKGLVVGSLAAMRAKIARSGDAEAMALLNRLSAKKTAVARLLEAPEEDAAAWKKKVEESEQEANELERQLVQRSAALAETTKRAHLTWHDVQSALREQEAAVEFAKFDYHDGTDWTDKTYYVALVLTRRMRAPKLILVGEAKTIERMALRDYRYSVGLDRMRIGRTVSFYDAVWRPIEESLRQSRRVYLAPDAVLNQVSLGILAGPDGRLLMQKYDLRTVSSTRDLLRSPATSQENTAVLAGNPNFDLHLRATGAGPSTGGSVRSREMLAEPLPPLPATGEELRAVDELLVQQKWKIELAEADKASEEAIKQVRHPRLLHLATHGFFQPDQPSRRTEPGERSPAVNEDPMLRSGLFFAGANSVLAGNDPAGASDDGILTSYEAMELDLQGTELVVMSACKTGLGEIMRGEGVFGLRRALEVAGAQSVLMSLWSVPDRETEELMVRFYRKWLGGKPKQEALQEAQLEMREVVKTRYGKDMPLYWGGFVLVGR